jgi:uncharacterized protein
MASSIEVQFSGRRFVLDSEIALYWPAEETLVVSDLHLEKATFFAQYGAALAPYDTLDTLVRLDKLVCRYAPKTLILLGDSFHDRQGWARLPAGAQQHLLNIADSVERCVFVEGNHDPADAAHPQLHYAAEMFVDGIAFRHEPGLSAGLQIVGHFHPKTRMNVKGYRVSGKCFAMNDGVMILPAFGSFTGGLDISHEAFAPFAQSAWRCYLIYKSVIVPALR